MSDNSNFFDNQTLSSKVKASIISEYFPQYCNIITKVRNPRQIGYFDMFSGPGIYNDGQLSTPILIGKKCETNPLLRRLVWMVFNDKQYGNKLKDNFQSYFPEGTFSNEPLFGNKTFGEFPQIDRFLCRNTYINKRNECPSILFIDPWGYKHINTPVLVKFLQSWGNEIFIFINTKRLNADIEKEISQTNLKIIFPTTYDQLRNEKKNLPSVEQRHKFIVDHLAKEFEFAYNGIYCTSFEFMEEDQATPSHYLLHITKGAKGFELIKQVYDRYANVHRAFSTNYVTYTFDPKIRLGGELFDEHFRQERIEYLKQQLRNAFCSQTISARQLFKTHQKECLYAERHYRLALRQMAEEGDIKVEYIDNINHKKSVVLCDECIIKFK